MHFGESIKEIINEEFGNGIMSAIDFYCSVDKIKGVDGKDRVSLAEFKSGDDRKAAADQALKAYEFVIFGF
ncbi:hypothetical protein LIER_37160 [Lithospermum erythrorhizon]|uniref:Cyanate lyase C-terminal domain-containing protein n=1 Tax=Lithospermum erythrorhizon TaxID=34254 RepID=A0AAV3PGA0_LITER